MIKMGYVPKKGDWFDAFIKRGHEKLSGELVLRDSKHPAGPFKCKMIDKYGNVEAFDEEDVMMKHVKPTWIFPQRNFTFTEYSDGKE